MLITRKLLLAIAGILLGGRPALQASFSTSVMVLGYIVHQRASPFLQVNNSSTRDHGVAAKLVLRQAAGATLPGSSDSGQLISSSLEHASTTAMAAAGASSPCKHLPHVVGSTRDRLQQRVQAIARPKATSTSGALSVAPKSSMAFFNADYNLFESAFLINSVSARAFPPPSPSLPPRLASVKPWSMVGEGDDVVRERAHVTIIITSGHALVCSGGGSKVERSACLQCLVFVWVDVLGL